MPTDNLSVALKAIENNSTPSYDKTIEFLQYAREARARMPEQVYKYGSYALKRYAGRLNLDEAWTLREEVAVAALLVGRTKEAFALVDQIQRQFPDSSKAARLMGMYYEAIKDFTKAEEIYKEELVKNPTNAAILRRTVAVRVGQGDLTGAAQLLKTYLDTHATDWSAWEEAASIYIRLAAYPQAIFCLEEVLLHQAGNMSAQMLMADTLYAAGGAANWETARGYYSGIIEITGGENARALYGAAACTAQLAGGQKRGTSSKNGGELGALVGETLVQQYSARNPEKLPLVEAMLRS